MHAAGKFNIRPVKILALPELNNGELSDKVTRQCDFCRKDVEVTLFNRALLEALSGAKNFYCRFCLQHGLHTRNNRNVLILSFRSILGYYYYEFYLGASINRHRMSYSEIEDYVLTHQAVGSQNPIFIFDPETFYWFVDFNRVGGGGKKVRVEEVHKTVLNILTCFNLWDVPNMQMHSLYEKYRTAIEAFYQKRFRPEGKRILLPSLVGCGLHEPVKGLFEKTRGFSSKQMCLK
jgi:hypothetical protein